MGLGAWVRSLFKPSVDDLARADSDVATLAEQLAAGDFAPLAARLSPLRQGSWSDRFYFLDALAGVATAEQLAAWGDAEPGHPLAPLVAGAMWLTRAIQAREAGEAAFSAEEPEADAAWQEVLGMCTRAEGLLEEAAARDPEDPTPLAFLVRVRQTAEDRAGAEHHFRQAALRDPDHYAAHAAMQAVLTRRWMGSHDESLAFARATAAAAPEGSDLPMLLITAHLEAWMYTWNFEENHSRASQRVADPAVLEEARAAWQSSLGSATYRSSRHTLHRRSEASFWFYLVGDRERLRRELDLLGNRFTQVPWCWDVDYRDPAQSFLAARRQVGLA